MAATRGKRMYAVVFLATLLTVSLAGPLAAQTAFCDCGGTLTFGGIGYGDAWDLPLTRLIAYLNGYLKNELPGFPQIRREPALLSYENGIAFASDDQLDIALL